MDKIKLKYSIGRTVNLGNYESARVDCGIEAMCENSKKEINRVWELIKGYVDEKLKEGVKECQV